MTIEKSIIESAKMIDLINLAGQYTELGKASGTREWCGPCPKCAGDDRFHVKTAGFFCRQCKKLEDNNGIWYDQIDFVRWMDGCDFSTAIGKLVGGLPLKNRAATPTVHSKPHQEHHSGWIEKATAVMEDSHSYLMGGAVSGYDYLVGRGISQESMRTFKLGFASSVALPGTWDEKKRIHTQPKHPAIVIPWLRRGKVAGIRYRFLETHAYVDLKGRTRTTKQSAVYDSDFTGVFGGQTVLGCAEEKRTLVLCEGELNDISIRQVARNWDFDVLSIGSETSKIAQPILDYAKKFGRFLIWVDRLDQSKRLMALIPGAFGINSLIVDERKQDANSMLQAGTLGTMLAEARYLACRSDTERLALLWSIQDSVTQGDFDMGACEVALMIANDMGVKL